jgi:urease accessory protein
MNRLDSTASSEWLFLQLADSSFPTGGFAHSGGLEAAHHCKEVRTREDLIDFLESALAQCARGSLPFVRAGHRQEQPFAEIDRLFDAFTSNHIANRASRLQGRAFLSSADRAFDQPRISELRSYAEDEDLPRHFPVVFGAVLRFLGFDCLATLRLVLHNQLRSCLSSAVRLNILGPIDAQNLQFSLAPVAEWQLTLCADMPLASAAQTAPILDLLQGMQDRLYSRLFQS